MRVTQRIPEMDMIGPFVVIFVVSLLLLFWTGCKVRWSIHVFCLIAALPFLFLSFMFVRDLHSRLIPDSLDCTFLRAVTVEIALWLPNALCLGILWFTALRHMDAGRGLTPLTLVLLPLVYSNFMLLVFFIFLGFNPGS